METMFCAKVIGILYCRSGKTQKMIQKLLRMTLTMRTCFCSGASSASSAVVIQVRLYHSWPCRLMDGSMLRCTADTYNEWMFTVCEWVSTVTGQYRMRCSQQITRLVRPIFHLARYVTSRSTRSTCRVVWDEYVERVELGLFQHGGRRTSNCARLYKFSRYTVCAVTYTNPICSGKWNKLINVYSNKLVNNLHIINTQQTTLRGAPVALVVSSRAARVSE